MHWGTGGKATSLALSPSPWVCKTAASAGAGVCPLGHRRSPRQSQPGQQRGIPRAALKHVRAPSSHWEEVLVLQDGFERGFCSLGGAGKQLCPICARQRDGVTCSMSCPFPSSWPLQRALLACSLPAAPQPQAEPAPRSQPPSVSRVRVPRRSARAVRTVRRC